MKNTKKPRHKRRRSIVSNTSVKASKLPRKSIKSRRNFKKPDLKLDIKSIKKSEKEKETQDTPRIIPSTTKARYGTKHGIKMTKTPMGKRRAMTKRTSNQRRKRMPKKNTVSNSTKSLTDRNASFVSSGGDSSSGSKKVPRKAFHKRRGSHAASTGNIHSFKKGNKKVIRGDNNLLNPKVFSKKKEASTAKTFTPREEKKIEEDLSFDILFQRLEKRGSKKVKQDSLIKIEKYIQSQEELQKLFDLIKIKKNEFNPILVTKIFLRKRSKNFFKAENFFEIFNEEMLAKLPDKKHGMIMREMLGFSFVDYGPVEIFEKMEKYYFEHYCFSGRTASEYFSLFYECVAKGGRVFVPLPKLISLLRGFGFLHSTSSIKEKLGELKTLLKDNYIDDFEKYFGVEFDLLQVDEKPLKRKITPYELKHYQNKIQDDLVKYLEEEAAEKNQLEHVKIDREVKQILKEKNEIKLLEKLRLELIKVPKSEIHPKLGGAICKFLSKKMEDNNKQVMKTSIQLCAFFLETTKHVPQFSKIFTNGIIHPIRDKSSEVRFYALICFKHLVESNIKYFKFFLSQFLSAKDEAFDLLDLLMELIEKNPKYIHKFDKKIGFPVVLNLLVHKNKEIRIKAEKVLVKLLSFYEWKDFTKYKSRLKGQMVQTVDEVYRRIEEQKEFEIQEAIIDKKPIQNEIAPLFENIRNLGGEFVKKESLEEIRGIAKKHVRGDIFEMIFDECEKTTLSAIEAITKSVKDRPKNCLGAWALIIKILGLILKPESSGTLTSLVAKCIALLVSLKKASDDVIKPEEMWVFSELFVAITKTSVKKEDNLTLLDEMMLLVEGHDKEKDYIVSVIKNLDRNSFIKYFEKRHETEEVKEEKVEKKKDELDNILDNLNSDALSETSAKNHSIELLSLSHDLDSSLNRTREQINIDSLSELDGVIRTIERGTTTRIIDAFFKLKDLALDLEVEGIMKILKAFLTLLERIQVSMHSMQQITERFVLYSLSTIEEMISVVEDLEEELPKELSSEFVVKLMLITSCSCCGEVLTNKLNSLIGACSLNSEVGLTITKLIDYYTKQEEIAFKGNVGRVLLSLIDCNLQNIEKIDVKKITLKVKKILISNPELNVLLTILLKFRQFNLVDDQMLKVPHEGKQENFYFKNKTEFDETIIKILELEKSASDSIFGYVLEHRQTAIKKIEGKNNKIKRKKLVEEKDTILEDDPLQSDWDEDYKKFYNIHINKLKRIF